MKQFIIFIGFIVLGAAIYLLLTTTMETAASSLLTRTVTDINAINP